MHTVLQFESNPVPIPCLQPAELSEAFSSFINSANELEQSYRDLQDEVGRLRVELQESHSDLARSMAENERMSIYLSGIVESLPCGVIVLDRSGRPKMQNEEASRLFPAETAESFSILSKAAKQKIGSEQEYSLPTLHGEQWVAARRARLGAVKGVGNESVVIVRDVTEQHELEKERQTHRRMQALAEISAMLAHEIRNPLASMELFTFLLADSLPAQSDELGWVMQMQSGLRLLGATVNNVLQFHSETPLLQVRLDLHKLVKTTIALLDPIARQQQIEIILIADGTVLDIHGDGHKLQQVFFNLAVNAFRAMQPGQTLEVALAHANTEATIEFRDQGCGIAAEDIDRIFNPGFSGAKGAGLGLAVCRRIMQQHGGEISVRSVSGSGSTFRLEFPWMGEAE